MDFEDIRPYRDDELSNVIDRLVRSKFLASSIRQIVLPKTPRLLQKPVEFVIALTLKYKLRKIQTIYQLQREIMLDTLLQPVINKTITALTCSGLEKHDPKQACLYITNHRDIVLDSALLNYVLRKEGFNITQIAFGDNLLINETVTDLIRVNRSFIVKRNLPLRQQIQASIELSAYINNSLNEGESIWLAQSSGRAKDGNDTTSQAVIKMCYLAKRKSGISFSEYIKNRNIAPAVISYEYDPCDRMKGWELYRKRCKGGHEKGKYEDLVSMAAGIKGYKGRVHVTFCEPLQDYYPDEKAVCLEIDRRIHLGYHLWPTNYIAWDILNGSSLHKEHYSQQEHDSFNKRFAGLSHGVREAVLEGYANPVTNKEEMYKR